MKHLEFPQEMRIDNLAYLVPMPSLRMLWSSMSIFRARVEFGAVIYGLRTVTGVSRVAKARFPVSCGVMVALWLSWEMIEAVKLKGRIFIPSCARNGVRLYGSQKVAPCLSFPFEHDFSLALTLPEPCRMQFGGRKGLEVTVLSAQIPDTT